MKLPQRRQKERMGISPMDDADCSDADRTQINDRKMRGIVCPFALGKGWAVPFCVFC